MCSQIFLDTIPTSDQTFVFSSKLRVIFLTRTNGTIVQKPHVFHARRMKTQLQVEDFHNRHCGGPVRYWGSFDMQQSVFESFLQHCQRKRRHAAPIQRAERAQNNAATQKTQKRGKQFCLHFASLQSAVSVNCITPQWLIQVLLSNKYKVCVIVYLKYLSAGQQHSCRNWKKAFVKLKCLPKENKF